MAWRRLAISRCYAIQACGSPMEMSPVAPTEMSLRQGVVGARGLRVMSWDATSKKAGSDPAPFKSAAKGLVAARGAEAPAPAREACSSFHPAGSHAVGGPAAATQGHRASATSQSCGVGSSLYGHRHQQSTPGPLSMVRAWDGPARYFRVRRLFRVPERARLLWSGRCRQFPSRRFPLPRPRTR
jgi:hypothetical protein